MFNCRKMKAGDKYTVLGENTDTGFVAKKIVYEESKLNYVVFNLDDSLYIYRGKNQVHRKRQEVAGVINGSLYETFDEMGVPSGLAMRLADVFSCTIDFYKIQKGDKFKIIYDQDFVDEKPIGVGVISAAVFNSSGKDYYAFYYEKDPSHEGEYYDELGNSMRKQFLKAPLKFFQITSKYSLNRFHPVAQEWRAHLGTDYAAAYGTPILATADGVVEEAQFGVYNGNYVKIRHNGQYKTQYLHMSKIGQGMHPGRHVKQGETIGYVGSTGLATGPHVCYRFWKDGQQVDPFKQKLQFSDPLAKKYLGEFKTKSAPFKTSIDQLAYGTKPVMPEEEKLQALQSNYDAKALMARFF
jgi:murein DD-endopeptidase MepM/ murein hydrolase activator NlpD